MGGVLNPSVTIEIFEISICNAFYLFTVCLRHRPENLATQMFSLPLQHVHVQSRLSSRAHAKVHLVQIVK